jgi:hypothetical protein
LDKDALVETESDEMRRVVGACRCQLDDLEMDGIKRDGDLEGDQIASAVMSTMRYEVRQSVGGNICKGGQRRRKGVGIKTQRRMKDAMRL